MRKPPDWALCRGISSKGVRSSLNTKEERRDRSSPDPPTPHLGAPPWGSPSQAPTVVYRTGDWGSSLVEATRAGVPSPQGSPVPGTPCPTPHRVRGKIVFQEPRPWCQKAGDRWARGRRTGRELVCGASEGTDGELGGTRPPPRLPLGLSRPSPRRSVLRSQEGDFGAGAPKKRLGTNRWFSV